jgi:hypothetical protein
MPVQSVYKDLLIFLMSRGLTVILSLVLFTLFTNKLNFVDGQKAAYFLFVLGFGTSAVRFLMQVSCTIEGHKKIRLNMPFIYRGISQSLIVHAFLLPVLAYVLFNHSQSWTLAFGSLLVVSASGLDADILRSTFGKPFLSPLYFGVGTVMAILGVLILPELTLESACWLTLVQWIPVGLYNLAVYHRFWRRLYFDWDFKSLLNLLSLLFVGVFDGLVLNGSFLGLFVLSGHSALEMAGFMRIFSSSLPFLPLVLHWSNNGTLSRWSNQYKVSIQVLFVALLSISGFFTASLLGFFFVFFSSWSLSFWVYPLLMLLIIAYSVYASTVRLDFQNKSSAQKMRALLGPFTIFVACSVFLSSWFTAGPYRLYLLQSGILLISGLMISSHRLQAGPNGSPRIR